MIDRTVLLRIPEASRDAALADLDPAIRALATIDGIERVSWGANANDEGKDHGFTHGFVLQARDAAALAAYAPHPTHQIVVEAVDRWADDVLVFDVGS